MAAERDATFIGRNSIFARSRFSLSTRFAVNRICLEGESQTASTERVDHSLLDAAGKHTETAELRNLAKYKIRIRYHTIDFVTIKPKPHTTLQAMYYPTGKLNDCCAIM